ncbi:hypothetical protein SNEBB_002731 [Seison nebaliae]|nr:hypothetical protein SNEBB_002731 [Seison nebaliae]
MGILVSTIWNALLGKKEYKVIIVGLDNAGKTTILYQYLLNDTVHTSPTIGSNVEEISYNNMRFIMWDIGGQDTLRSSWNTYYEDASCIILVVDSADRERMPITKTELMKLLSHDSLKKACLLVLANKQDLASAQSGAELSQFLNLTSVKTHTWHIQPCCALSGEGLMSGIEWLSKHVT